MEEARIRKRGVLSFANISAMINIFVGFILGIVVSLLSLVSPAYSGTLNSFGIPIFFSIAIFPIIYGILGFIGGAVGAVFYNLSAKITKGVKLYSD